MKLNLYAMASLLAALSLYTGVASSEELDSCVSVDLCIQRLYEVAEAPESPYLPVSKKEWAVANKLSSFGEPAVDRLIPLLKDSNENVAQIAAAALRNIPRIDEKYLAEITDALDGDYNLGWLPPALGRIDSDAAAKEAVKRYVGSQSAPHNQEAYALKLSGSRAVPFIIQRGLCKTPCGRADHYQLGAVLAEMDEEARSEAAALIVDYLQSPDTNEEGLNGLIYLLSFLDTAAQVAEQQLLELRHKRSDLAGVVNTALIGMKSPHAAEAFAYRLSIEPDSLVLRDLSEMGPAGRGAGNVVAGLMDHESRDIRVAATLTVGFIGYQEAIPKLIEVLEEPGNLKLNWAAAQSLGRLQAATAEPALKRVANKHWYPSVRSAARRALSNIKTGEEYAAEKEGYATYSFFGQWYEEIEACEKIRLAAVDEDKATKLYQRHAEEQLKTLAFPSEVVGYGASDEAEQRAVDPDAIVVVNADNMVEHREPILQVPEVALRAGSGWLVGSDRGEWGGELAYIADSKQLELILHENIEDIYKLGDRYVVVAGLAHLGMNDGLIYEVAKSGNSWIAKPWLTLPGAPRTSWLVETGELMINTYGGGSILVSAKGKMRMAKCL